MDKIYNIKYVDAYHIYAKNISQTKLSLHEAHGYMKRNGNNIIIAFIKKRLAHGKEEVALGLVIPNNALFRFKNNFKNKVLGLDIGVPVSVIWRDVVIFDSGDLRNDCPIMYTEGILFKVEKDRIVLKNPETICIYPKPIRNHPIKKPSYYIIPISFITDITIIK